MCAASSKSKIDQKEYLKKYLYADKGKRRKKDRRQLHGENVKILDDDADAPDIDYDDELLLGGEDAPQIVGEYADEYGRSEKNGKKWRSFGENGAFKKEEDKWGRKSGIDRKVKDEYSPRHRKSADLSPPRKRDYKYGSKSKDAEWRSDSDQSPPRRNLRRSTSVDLSPSRRKHDSQPQRKERYQRSRSRDLSPQRRGRNIEPDQSPPRRRNPGNIQPFRDRQAQRRDRPFSPNRWRRNRETGQQNQRQNRNFNNQQHFQQRRQDFNRQKRGDNFREQNPQQRQWNNRNNNSNMQRQRRSRSAEGYKPRRRNDSYQARNGSHERQDNDAQKNFRNPFRSPPRQQSPSLKQQDFPPNRRQFRNDGQQYNKNPHHQNADQSPHGKRSTNRMFSPDRSPSRQNKKRHNSSSPQTSYRHRSYDRNSPPPTHKPRMDKTLDGKRAGLQDAKSMKDEIEDRRRREERMYAGMSKHASGRDAEVQMRSTGRRGKYARDAEDEDPEVRRHKEEREQHKKEQYDRWGRGVKQVEDYRTRMEEHAYESSKPLARYANDDDLERHLRQKERVDDPMLDYMRRKKKEHDKDAKIPSIPVYEGSYPENRYGIRPGYRWDGVDRSNGYEKKWFDRQNEKRAAQEEAYKYSVEDM